MSEIGPQPNPFELLTDEQIRERIRKAEHYLFENELLAIELGFATPDELAEEARRVEEPFVYRPEDWED